MYIRVKRTLDIIDKILAKNVKFCRVARLDRLPKAIKKSKNDMFYLLYFYTDIM